MLGARKMTDYEKSNSILEVKFNPSKKLKGLVEIFLVGYTDNDAKDLTLRIATELGLHLSRVNIIAKGRAYKYNRYSVRVLGYARNGRSITLYTRTPKRGVRVASKTMLTTIVHELMHIYDHQKLNLNSSPHTKGFYSRINSVLKALI